MHREVVRATISRIEQALHTDDETALVAAARHIVDLVREHIALTEGPDGVLADVLARDPRLNHATEGLLQEHGELADLARHLLHVADRTEGAAPHLRDAASELIERLQAHRRKGASLIFDAYAIDLGNGD